MVYVFCCRSNIPANFTRSGNKLSHQKDTRQATFLFRRGLKVLKKTLGDVFILP